MKKYRINEIFYSVQGEGFYAGTPAVFIRFSGCNLKCPFCDTDFKEYKEMTVDEIATEVERVNYGKCEHIVVTGGEPTLQWDKDLYSTLDRLGYYVAMETNGTNPVKDVDWLTISPKIQWLENAAVAIENYEGDMVDEVKVVVDEKTDFELLVQLPQLFTGSSPRFYVQPCDTGYIKRNAEIMARCIEFVKMFPTWQISIQQQKILKVR